MSQVCPSVSHVELSALPDSSATPLSIARGGPAESCITVTSSTGRDTTPRLLARPSGVCTGQQLWVPGRVSPRHPENTSQTPPFVQSRANPGWGWVATGGVTVPRRRPTDSTDVSSVTSSEWRHRTSRNGSVCSGGRRTGKPRRSGGSDGVRNRQNRSHQVHVKSAPLKSESKLSSNALLVIS